MGAVQLTAGTRWARAIDRARIPGSAILTAWRAEQGPETRKLASRAQAIARRGYAGAAIGRTTSDWSALGTSADAELYTSLRALRNRTRQLARDNEYAKQALRLIANNVVGQGIGFQAQVMMRGGKLNEAVNSKIEKAWARWSKAKYCHTAGKLSWAAIQRMVMRTLPESGEILLRKVRRQVPGSPVPFQLEVIEADQLVENWSGRTGPTANQVRMGVEIDEWQKPVAYWLLPRHPGDNMVSGIPPSNEYQRVPAEDVIHLALFERPGQTRGVPWFHAAMTKLRHMGGYEEALIVRARAAASVMGFIKSDLSDGPLGTGEDPMGADAVVNGEKVFDMSPGIIKELAPGESFEGFDPKTSDATVEPFMRFMLRSVAAGIGLSYESLSRDYSQSNYSSSRLALLDDRDNWKVLQQWLMETLHQEVFEEWLQLAVLNGTLELPSYEASPDTYQAVRWMPRGWDWVDPAKEVAAAKAAVRAGFASLQDIVSAKGGDIEDVFTQRKREIDMAADLGLVLDTDPAQLNDKGQIQAPPATGEAAAEAAGGGEDAAPGGADAEPTDPASSSDDTAT